MKKVLKGITWAHTRGIAPMQVTSQVYSDFHPEVEIKWDIRSLHDFGEGKLTDLVQEYDFLLVDHPFMGVVAESELFVPLDKHYLPEDLQTLSNESVGASFSSYNYNGHQWALPIDAAAQVSAARNDLMESFGYSIPTSWGEVLELSKKTGKVAMPLTPMATLGMFFTLCNSHGEEPFKNFDNQVVDTKVAEIVLSQMLELFETMPNWCLDVYPPYIFNKMATSNEIWYVPLSYGYVNYSTKGYAAECITFLDIPQNFNGISGGATLGGVGIALSKYCKNLDVALDYAKWVTGSLCQSTIYSLSGGQPANIKAWNDDLLNTISNNFYRNTICTLENAFVRPRYSGFHHFQTLSGRLLQSFLKKEISVGETINAMNKNLSNSINNNNKFQSYEKL
jgi:multiple sugar transport system substrate-binding protein